MMSPRAGFRPALTVAVMMALALHALPAAGGAAPGAEAPMTNEDVVRMSARHAPDSAIIAAIHQAAVTRFDLDPDVVVELRRAGVSDTVIEAMRRAQPSGGSSVAEPGAAPAEAPRIAAARVPLIVRFTAWTAGAPPASAQRPTAEPEPAAPLDKPVVEAPLHDPMGKPNGLALYVMCLDPTHVPDGWMASPLAASFPRHHLLWFLEGHPIDGGDQRTAPRLQLDLPGEVPLELEPGAHLLQIGLAGKSGEGPWGPLAESSARMKAQAGVPITLRVALSGRLGGRRTRTSGYHCRIDGSDPPGAVEILKELEAPPGSRPSAPP